MGKNILPKDEKDRQALLLNQDYGLYLGNLIVEDGKTKCNPMEYLEDYMSAHEQPPYEVCVQFLLQFYTYDSVCEWTAKIAWNEDEAYEIARDFIRESVADGSWEKLLGRCEAIEEDFLAVDWEWYGFGDLVDNGRVDQEIYARQAALVLEELAESNQGAVEMIVENLQETIAERKQERDMEKHIEGAVEEIEDVKLFAFTEAEWTNVVCALKDVADIYETNMKNMEGEDKEGCVHDLFLTQSIIKKLDPEGII